MREQRPRSVAVRRVDHAEMRTRFRRFDDGELAEWEDHDKRTLALGKICGKGADQGRLKIIRVLPDGLGVIVAPQHPTGSDFRVADPAQGMIAVDIGDVQACVRDFIDRRGGQLVTGRQSSRDHSPAIRVHKGVA